MSFETVIESLSEETDRLIDEYAQEIPANAQENPRELEDLPDELIISLIILWEQAIDDMAIEAKEETNEQLDSDDPLSISEADKERYKEVGAYYFLQAMRESFHKVHSASIALQIEESERDEAIERAIESGKQSVNDAAFTELAFAYGAFIQKEQIARGIQSYRWQTREDSRVRPTHRANNGRIFSWNNPPSTGHPGTAINCRCSAIPQIIEGKNKSMKAKKVDGLTVKALSDGHVKIEIMGDIGDEWDGINTVDWQVKNFNGINEDTQVMDVYINSRGGDLAQGIAIYTFFKQHPAQVNTHITGEASSAASLIFLSGDRRFMPEGTFAGVHNPYAEQCFCGLDYEVAQQIADQLKPHAESMIEIYSANMTASEEEIRDMLSRNHVITSQEALRIGFATAVTPNDEMLSNPDAKKTAIKARLERMNTDFVNSVTDEEIKMSNTPKEGNGGVTVVEIQAKHDVLAHKNAELESENSALQAKIQELENRQESLRAAIKAEVLEEQALIADVKAKATESGIEPSGDTADEIMLNAIKAKGVSDVTPFTANQDDDPAVASSKSAALKSVFQTVVAQYGSKQADTVYSNNQSKTEKSDPWAKANAAV